MKRLIYLLSIALWLSLSGCAKDVVGKISIPMDNNTLPAEGGEGYFMFNSTHSWEASCDKEWVKLNETIGKAGSNKINYTIAPNLEKSARQAIITVTNSAAAKEGKYTITQEAFVPQITIAPQEVEFGVIGGSKFITIEANFQYSIQNDYEWLSYTTSEGGIQLIAEPSFETETRTAEIFVVNSKYEVSESVSVSQEEFKPMLEINNHDLTIGANAGTHTVKVYSNISYDIHCDADWLECIAIDGAIQITVQASTLNTERETTIVLSNDTYNISEEMVLTQEAGVVLPVELSNSDFEQGLQGWSIKKYHNGTKTKVEVVDGAGINGSKAVKISQAAADLKCSVAVERKLTGLDPDQMYRLVAQVRYENVAEGCGAVMFSPNTDQYWNASEYTYGTNTTYKKVFVDFLADATGNATISLALGFWQGGLANGGRSTGVAYYDDVEVIKVTANELYMRESEHMCIYWDPTKVKCADHFIDTWLANIDKMYESYKELVGITPQNGRQFKMLSTPGMYRGYVALAGYPILIGVSHIPSIISEISTHQTMNFGMMHEIGHVFNLGQTNWNWNDEMFANFRMQYALEMNNLGVYVKGALDSSTKVYTGREILNMYKQDYDKTLPKGKLNDNAIHYLLARLAGDEFIGWEPFKKTFREVRSNSCPYSNKYDKFTYFVNILSKHASTVHGKEIDLLNDKSCFSDADIAAIKAQLQ